MKELRRFMVPAGVLVGVFLVVVAVLGREAGPVSAVADAPTDSLWGEASSPCETLGFDKSLRVTIPLNQRERELIHLAMAGFKADMEHEKVGTSAAVPPFGLRSFFLGFFISEVVPSIQSRVAGAFVDEFPTPENERAMLASVQNVEFGACERNAISIGIENWTVKSGGQMSAHLKICQASRELRDATACQSFEPLGKAYSTLTRKIQTDQ